MLKNYYFGLISLFFQELVLLLLICFCDLDQHLLWGSGSIMLIWILETHNADLHLKHLSDTA